jgi:hypothetical protein
MWNVPARSTGRGITARIFDKNLPVFHWKCAQFLGKTNLLFMAHP